MVLGCSYNSIEQQTSNKKLQKYANDRNAVFVNKMSKLSDYLQKTDQDKEAIIANDSIIGHSWVAPSLQKLLVVKVGDIYCGVQFISFDKNSASGDGFTYHATLRRSRFREDQQGILVEVGNHTTENLDKLKRIGVGKVSFQPGQIGIKCNGEYLSWSYPTNLSIKPSMKYALANLHDETALSTESLDWFENQKNRDLILIPN